MIENWEEFGEDIEKLSLHELEVIIKELFEEFKRNHHYKDDRLNACLVQRKYLINKHFKFTPEAVKYIQRVNLILTESTAKVLQRTGLLYRQMLKLKMQGDDFLDDFDVEGTVAVEFCGEESVLMLDEDENNSQSDYVAMADVLEYTNGAFECLRSFSFQYTANAELQANNKEQSIKDDTLKVNWDIELLEAPELSVIEYFYYASHRMFVDSNYSISDAIRIKYIWNEVK